MHTVYFLPISCFSLDFYDGLDTVYALSLKSTKGSQTTPKYGPLSGSTSVLAFPHKHMQAIQKVRRNVSSKSCKL